MSELRIRTCEGERVLAFAVDNEGARDGGFAARVSREGFSGGSVVTFSVPAGESRTDTGRPGDVLR